MKKQNVRAARRKAAAGADRLDKHVADRDYVRGHMAEEGIALPPVDKKKD
jgi:hypothetical protein